MALDRLVSSLIEQHPQQAAVIFGQHALDEQIMVLTEATVEQASMLVRELPLSHAYHIFYHIDEGLASKIIVQLNHSQAASIIRSLPEDRQQRLINTLPQKSKTKIIHYMAQPAGSVAQHMDSTVLTLTSNMSVFDAIKLARQTQGTPYSTLFVLDDKKNIIGQISIHSLWLANRKISLATLLAPCEFTLSPTDKLSGLFNHPAWLSQDALPIIDAQQQFLGVIAQRTVLREVYQRIKDVKATSESSILSTLVEFSELLWNTGADLFTEATKQKDMNK